MSFTTNQVSTASWDTLDPEIEFCWPRKLLWPKINMLSLGLLLETKSIFQSAAFCFPCACLADLRDRSFDCSKVCSWKTALPAQSFSKLLFHLELVLQVLFRFINRLYSLDAAILSVCINSLQNQTNISVIASDFFTIIHRCSWQQSSFSRNPSLLCDDTHSSLHPVPSVNSRKLFVSCPRPEVIIPLISYHVVESFSDTVP